jgi:dTDP-4-dehydrorhamnose reductase
VVVVVDPSAAIVRTSLILGDARSSQVRFCLDLLTGRVSGHLFSDEIRCQVDVTDLASAVLELIGRATPGCSTFPAPRRSPGQRQA